MQAIVRWCLANRAVVVLFSLILMGAGTFSIFRINQELLPSVEFPGVFVLVPETGAGPQQVDAVKVAMSLGRSLLVVVLDGNEDVVIIERDAEMDGRLRMQDHVGDELRSQQLDGLQDRPRHLSA